jgi:hypothetical protein
LNGSGSDVDGTIASYQWTKISGPSQYSIVSAKKAQTTVNNLSQGTYQFELTVTDNQGATGKDTVIVTVYAAAQTLNQPPTVNAGPDVTITLPNNNVTLSGSASIPTACILSMDSNFGPADDIISPTQLARTSPI